MSTSQAWTVDFKISVLHPGYLIPTVVPGHLVPSSWLSEQHLFRWNADVCTYRSPNHLNFPKMRTLGVSLCVC